MLGFSQAVIVRCRTDIYLMAVITGKVTSIIPLYSKNVKVLTPIILSVKNVWVALITPPWQINSGYFSISKGIARKLTLTTSYTLNTVINTLYIIFILFHFIFYFLKIFIVIQLQLSVFSPHLSTPPQPIPPFSSTSTVPLDFVHVSFIVATVNPSPHYPFPTPLGLLLHCS